jgi:tetratricopeptide (TPR) repeat protein
MKLNKIQVILIFFTLFITTYLLSALGKYWLADYYYNKHNYAQAIKLAPYQPLYYIDVDINTALRISPNNLGIIKSAAAIYLKVKQYDQGIFYLKKAITLSPNDPKLYYNLGLTYLKLEQPKLALTLFKKALELKPDYQDAQSVLKYLDAQENR